MIRNPWQGVKNIIRFNWHFYMLAGFAVLSLILVSTYVAGWMSWFCIALVIGIISSTSISILVSHLVYDRSGLYEFPWLTPLKTSDIRNIANIHAGFDETSLLLKKAFPGAEVQTFDFYDPSKHTEVSIERARKAYPPDASVRKISTSSLPLDHVSVDLIFNIFALHEIRNSDERIRFLNEQNRTLSKNGKVIIVEHLRDTPNFLAYNIGFLHFLPEKEWKRNFQDAGLVINNKFKVTPFVTIYILMKGHGNTH